MTRTRTSGSLHASQITGVTRVLLLMPTGIPKVNDSASAGQLGDKDCSLVFRWTSKKNTLSAYDRMLEDVSREINSLTMHVDFLPAVEEHKTEPYKAECEHEFFIVSKCCKI